MIFILPCKYSEHCLIEEAVNNIKLYHPEDSIVVVDSNSDDKSYFRRIADKAIVEDVANTNYEAGAFWHVVKKYYSDHYVLLQDSMLIKRNITEFVGDFKAFINFFESSENQTMIYSGITNEVYNKRIGELLGELKFPESYNESFTGVFGCNMLVSREMVDRMLGFKCDEHLKPTNKFDSEIAERAFGIIAKRLGVDVSNNTIVGNLHQLQMTNFNAEEKILYTDILIKKWVSKHRQ